MQLIWKQTIFKKTPENSVLAERRGIVNSEWYLLRNSREWQNLWIIMHLKGSKDYYWTYHVLTKKQHQKQKNHDERKCSSAREQWDIFIEESCLCFVPRRNNGMIVEVILDYSATSNPPFCPLKCLTYTINNYQALRLIS